MAEMKRLVDSDTLGARKKEWNKSVFKSEKDELSHEQNLFNVISN